MKTLVLAVGGNALLDFGEKPAFRAQLRNAERMARSMGPLLKRKGIRIVITHGNGPQVGDELMRNEFAEKMVPRLPLHALTAETQALIGTMLETALRQEMARIGTKRDVATVITHVRVDAHDSAFAKPTKPIGPFYTKAQLERALEMERFSFVKERGRYRRVVASPRPLEIVELDSIRSLAEKGTVVIAAGGGGIPVAGKGKGHAGIDAVIDKDEASQLLASKLKADTLAILTNVAYVYSDFKNMRDPIRSISAKSLSLRLDSFEAGTMRPKLDACARFVRNGGRDAYVGSLLKLEDVLAGKSGTRITK